MGRDEENCPSFHRWYPYGADNSSSIRLVSRLGRSSSSLDLNHPQGRILSSHFLSLGIRLSRFSFILDNWDSSHDLDGSSLVSEFGDRPFLLALHYSLGCSFSGSLVRSHEISFPFLWVGANFGGGCGMVWFGSSLE